MNLQLGVVKLRDSVLRNASRCPVALRYEFQSLASFENLRVVGLEGKNSSLW